MSEDEMAIRAFALFHEKYLKDMDAYILPKWFTKARENLTRDTTRDLFIDEKDSIKKE